MREIRSWSCVPSRPGDDGEMVFGSKQETPADRSVGNRAFHRKTDNDNAQSIPSLKSDTSNNSVGEIERSFSETYPKINEKRPVRERNSGWNSHPGLGHFGHGKGCVELAGCRGQGKCPSGGHWPPVLGKLGWAEIPE